MKLEDVLLRDDRASQPLASAVPEGTLYYVTDEAVTEQSRASAWVTYSDAGSVGGDVTGPAVALDENVVVFNGTTGKIIKDGGKSIAGVEADAAVLAINFLKTFSYITENDETADLPNSIQLVIKQQIGITVDGGGTLLTTGVKGFKSFPVAGTIIGVRLIANAAGDIQFDIKKSTYAAFPTQASIVAAAPPELVGVQKNEDVTLTGWTTAVAAGDIFGFEITGVPATITRVTLELTILVS